MQNFDQFNYFEEKGSSMKFGWRLVKSNNFHEQNWLEWKKKYFHEIWSKFCQSNKFYEELF